LKQQKTINKQNTIVIEIIILNQKMTKWIKKRYRRNSYNLNTQLITQKSNTKKIQN
jgi:hypothetical protein